MIVQVSAFVAGGIIVIRQVWLSDQLDGCTAAISAGLSWIQQDGTADSEDELAELDDDPNICRILHRCARRYDIQFRLDAEPCRALCQTPTVCALVSNALAIRKPTGVVSDPRYLGTNCHIQLCRMCGFAARFGTTYALSSMHCAV